MPFSRESAELFRNVEISEKCLHCRFIAVILGLLHTSNCIPVGFLQNSDYTM